MLNIEKYKGDILNAKQSDITCCVIDLFHNGACPENCKDCKREAMEWLLAECKEPILDDVEKEYLQAIIKRFGREIKYIAKFKSACSENRQYIHIGFYEGDGFSFPYFKANSMYKGMELNKAYTLQELGL